MTESVARYHVGGVDCAEAAKEVEAAVGRLPVVTGDVSILSATCRLSTWVSKVGTGSPRERCTERRNFRRPRSSSQRRYSQHGNPKDRPCRR
jgi:hypothetical protein